MAASASIIPTASLYFSTKSPFSSSITTHRALPFSQLKGPTLSLAGKPKPRTFIARLIASPSTTPTPSVAAYSENFDGFSYVVGDNIDIEQMIRNHEYEHFGSNSIVIAGSDFGHGLSPEPALAALEAAGVVAVVADSYAPHFLRNSMAMSGIRLLESELRLSEECKTGHVFTVELGKRQLINRSTGKSYRLKPIKTGGGGNSECGRQNGKMMIPSQSHWVSLIYVAVLTASLLGAAQRPPITIINNNNIINELREDLPKAAPSIENKNWLGINVCSIKQNTDK